MKNIAKTIAIIDDDVPIGDMLCEVLEKEGYSVCRAYSGTEALYLLAQKRPDLILLDLMLPGLCGEEVLKHTSGIPVIVISAKVDVEDKVNLLMSGAVGAHRGAPQDCGNAFGTSFFWGFKIGRTAPAGDRSQSGGKTYEDRVCDFEAADAAGRRRDFKVSHFGAYQFRYAGLHRGFAENPCQQSSQEAA